MKNPTHQKGLALVVLIIAIVLAFTSYIVSELSVPELKLQQEEKTITALNKAKQALLDYAVLHVDGDPGYYGYLPCPDKGVSGTEGGTFISCDTKKFNTLGLFPWASLETGILRSSSGNCLWYALSGEYKSVNAGRTEMLNEDSNGAFRIYDAEGNIRQGANPEDRVVAVIIDPSSPLPGQNRNFDVTSQCGLDYFPTEYLEGDAVINNSLLSGGELTIDEFINRGVGTDQLPTPFNDRLVTITRQELWDAVTSRQDFEQNTNSSMRRLTEALAMCIAAYGNNSGNRKLPRPAPFDFIGADYRIDGNYDDDTTNINFGRYPHTVNDSDVALIVNAPNPGEQIIFKKGFCNNLAVASPPTINLDTGVLTEGYLLWKNWKDHFFYAVSAYYEPTDVPDSPPLLPLPDHWCDGTNCIVINGVEYAAVVLYAGSRIDPQVRNEPKFVGDPDTKKELDNFLEVNALVDDDGTGDYTPTGNDIAFCITDLTPLTVVSCP